MIIAVVPKESDNVYWRGTRPPWVPVGVDIVTARAPVTVGVDVAVPPPPLPQAGPKRAQIARAAKERTPLRRREGAPRPVDVVIAPYSSPENTD